MLLVRPSHRPTQGEWNRHHFWVLGVARACTVGGFPGGLIGLCLPQRGFVVQMLGAVLGVPAGWEPRERTMDFGWGGEREKAFWRMWDLVLGGSLVQ